MNKKYIVILIIGIILTSLGILWFLQGYYIVYLEPILCFANCEPITGKSPLWQVMGAIAFVTGIILITKSIGRKE
jgi:hypothetical protein